MCITETCQIWIYQYSRCQIWTKCLCERCACTCIRRGPPRPDPPRSHSGYPAPPISRAGKKCQRMRCGRCAAMRCGRCAAMRCGRCAAMRCGRCVHSDAMRAVRGDAMRTIPTMVTAGAALRSHTAAVAVGGKSGARWATCEG